MDETSADTNNFASSFWMLLNGRRVNAAELFYRMWALSCSPPLQIFDSVFKRKILKMLRWCYLILGIIITCALRNFLIPISIELGITQASWYQQKRLFWPARWRLLKHLLKVLPRKLEVSSYALCKKTNCYINILWRSGRLSSHLAVSSVISLTVHSFNTGNIKSNCFHLPIISYIQYNMYIIYVILYPMYTYIHPINTG